MAILDLFRNRDAPAVFFAALLFSSCAAMAAEETPELSDTTYPVIVTGNHLDELHGREIAHIRLFAYRHGVMEAIPLQIDQRDSNGNWIWSGIVWSEIIEQTSMHDTADDIELQWQLGRRYGRTYDDQDPADKPVLDNNDVLVFMARDTGEHVANAADFLINAATTLEIEISDPASGDKAWAYAAYYPSDPPPRSPRRYVHYEPGTRKVTSPVYAITFSKEHVGVMEQLTVDGTPLLDRTKFRGSLRLGGSRIGRDFSFTEDDIEGYVYGYIDGPVRVVRRAVATLHFGPFFSSPTVGCDQFFYPYHSEIPVRLPVNFLVHSVSLLVAADYHRSPFRRVYTSTNGRPIPLRDGSSEDNLLKGTGDVHWVALTGDRVSVVSMLTASEDIASFTQITPWLLYDRKFIDPPETYRGAEPGAGYLIKTLPGFPSGKHVLMGIYLYLPRPFQERDAGQILELADQRLECRISTPGHTRANCCQVPHCALAHARSRE
jgi:hypothetical protein